MKRAELRDLILNAMVAALYVALSIIVSPFASGAIQFRISECLNHVVVFNKRLIWGVTLGVIIYNLWYSSLWDVLFGGAQTLLALALTIWFSRYCKNTIQKMLLNIVVFTISMFMIAWMLKITAHLPFWPTYFTTALSELIVMSITAPIMYAVGRVLPK